MSTSKKGVRPTCPRCGLEIAGGKLLAHCDATECLRYLVPRYSFAQRALKNMHSRYRTLEKRLERAQLQAQVGRAQAKKAATVEGRLVNLENVMQAFLGGIEQQARRQKE